MKAGQKKLEIEGKESYVPKVDVSCWTAVENHEPNELKMESLCIRIRRKINDGLMILRNAVMYSRNTLQDFSKDLVATVLCIKCWKWI